MMSTLITSLLSGRAKPVDGDGVATSGGIDSVRIKTILQQT